MELQRRGQDLRAEQRQREEENLRKEREMREQMDILRKLVGEIHDQGEASLREHEVRDKDVKLTKLMDTDDIEAYLTTFERQMTAYEVPRGRWIFKLAPQLSGRAQQAYPAMAADEAGDYEKVKEAILLRYDIDQESYRQWFRTAKKKEGETNRELAMRLLDLVEKWTKRCETLADIKDLIVMEQLVKTLLGEIGIFVVERQPKTAARLPDDYHLARRGREEENKKKTGAIRCLRCRKMGHIARDSRASLPQQTENEPKKNNGKNNHKKDLKDVECFNRRDITLLTFRIVPCSVWRDV